MWTILMAVVLIAGFFLPIGSHAKISAFDIVKAPGGAGEGFEGILFKYGWLIIPLSALMLLIGALNNGSYFISRGLWTILPLLFVLYFLIRPMTLPGMKFDLMGMIKGFGIGMWLMFVGSLLVAFVHPRSR